VVFVQITPPPPTEVVEGGAINDILVTARRTQNADIRRTENDVQPYQVVTRTDIERAHRDNVDQYMRSRVPANADLAAPAQNTFVEPGSVRSQIDLRGLGPARTLVLIDGRRVPSLPTGSSDYFQSDLNGLPVSAIERIETLTGTAGGIYGPGAIGGVVNVVLRRDYRGADIRLTSGLTSRGDSGRWGVEGRVGFTPDGGRTDVMILGAHSRSSPLLTGARDYALRARQLRFTNDPAAYAAAQFTADSVGILSRRGDLMLDPDKGGSSLGSPITFLPLNFTGSEAERLALLVANAGKVDLSVPQDRSGTGRSLVSRPEVTSILVNVRHRFGSGVQGFADLIYYSNAGRLRDNPGSPFIGTRADAPNNPFTQDIIFSYPEPNVLGEGRLGATTRRLTLGLIADLPGSWKANVDYAIGHATTAISQRRVITTSSYLDALRSGLPTPQGRALDPLGNWADFVAASAAYLEESNLAARLVNRFTDASVRLAGPLASLQGGPLTLTLLGESRRERVAPAKVYTRRGTSSGVFDTPDRSIRVRSAYAELRAPLVPDDARSAFRGLEVQLATRSDTIRTMFPVQPSFGFPSNGDLLQIDRHALTFTGGLRLFPLPRLMLRGSVATGELPPTIQQLSSVSSSFSVDVTGVGDPLRGGRRPGTEGLVEELRGGRPTMRSERARTVTVGAVFNPSGRRGPRVAIDFSRIDRRLEVAPFTPTRAELVANAQLYPERIVRAPLSDADRQAGFTAGRIVALDLRLENSGRSQIDSLDVQLDWRLDGPAGSEVRLSAAGTWQPRFRTRRSPLEPGFDRIGLADGPLRTRGNVGAEWSRGATTVGLNVQYHSGYLATYSDPSRVRLNPQIVRFQGTDRIPAQAYVDLAVSRLLRVGGGQAELGLGISNLLDASPPIVAQSGAPGYSLYGDPRRRRLDVTLVSRF
jgi:outer membrane receptor protein involved in Fe transport